MTDWLFYLFSALALLAGFFTAFSRGSVNAAMNMIICLVSVAALMVLLEAYFLAVLQVLVYAGAIVVLFVFIIMLISAEDSRRPGPISLLASVAALGLLCSGAAVLFLQGEGGPFVALSTEAPAANLKAYGQLLYTQYMLPFQLTGLMLLIAMIGVIVISRRVDGAKKGGVA